MENLDPLDQGLDLYPVGGIQLRYVLRAPRRDMTTPCSRLLDLQLSIRGEIARSTLSDVSLHSSDLLIYRLRIKHTSSLPTGRLG